MNVITEASRLSIVVAGTTTLLAVPLGLLLATLLYRSKLRSLELFLLLPLFLPPTVSGFVLLWLLSPLHSVGYWIEGVVGTIVFSLPGTILACLVVSLPLAFQASMVGLSRVDSKMLESGIILGGTPLLNRFRIVLPQMRGAVGISALLVFARALGEFGASIMVGGNIRGRTQTLPLLIYTQAESGDYGTAGQAALLISLLAVVVYFSLRFLETRGLKTGEQR